jgi:hypothetical protein
MYLYAEEKRIAMQGTGIQCEIFQGDLFITTYWRPALLSGEYISVNRLIYSLINAGQSKI